MASNRIKGITIQIGAETSDLNKALKNVDSQLSNTQKKLRDVNKLLKFDSGNTELLQQKQKYLQDAISNTSARLKELKGIQKDSLSPDEWDALQREIAETEQKLKGLQGEMKDFGSVAGQKLQAAGEKISAFGDGMANVGTKLTKTITAPLVGLGAAGIAAAKDLDDGYDTIIQKTGKTGDAFDDLKEQMDDVFGSMPVTAEEAGTAIGEVNTRFGLTGDTLEEVSKQFLEFAKVNNEDVNDSIDNIDTVMEKFGIDTKDTNKVLGLFTKAGQDSGVSMGTLYGALDKNGETLKNMGIGLTGSINLLSQFEANGINSSNAMTGLRNAQKKAAKEGKSLSSVLKTGVSQIKNATTETEAMNIATQLFGTKGAAEMTSAIRDGRLNLEDLTTSLDDYGDVVKETYEATQDPWDKMQVAVNQVKLAGAELGDELLKTLAPIIQTVADKIKEVTQWWRNLDDGTKQMIIKVGLLAAAVGPLLVVVGKGISLFGSVVGGIGKVVGAFSLVKTAIAGAGGLIPLLGSLLTAAGPFLIGGAIAVGVAGLTVLIVKNWDKIKAAGKKLGKAFGELGKLGIKAMQDMGKKVSAAASSMWGNVKDTVGRLKNTVVTNFQNMQTTVINAWNKIKTGVTSAANSVKTTVTGAWNTIKTGASTAWNSVKTATTNGLTKVHDSIKTRFVTIKDSMGAAWDRISTNATAKWNGIKNAVGAGMNNMKNSISERMIGIRDMIGSRWEGIKSTTEGWWGRIKTAASSGINAVKSGISTTMESIKSGLGIAWDGVKSAMTVKLSSIRDIASNTFKSVSATVRSVFSGMGSKIKNPFTNLPKAAQSVVSRVKSIFSSFQIKLPKIKLPHIEVKWQKLIGGDKFNISIPRFSIQWYKKAYQDAVMFNSPTVIPTAGGMKGFGDGSGAEIVIGLDRLRKLVGATDRGDTTINIYAQPGMDVNQLADAVQSRLVALQRQRERAFA